MHTALLTWLTVVPPSTTPSRWARRAGPRPSRPCSSARRACPLAPKDLRSSFITFLLSDANPDEALKKAVAHAMRHSPAQQGSPAYDKEAAERTWASAVQVAGAYAARFE